MKISPNCVVALTWTLKDTLGEELDVLDEPVEFLVGGRDLLPPLEQALQGQTAGAELELQIEPEQAFGDFDEQLIFLEPRNIFPQELQEGDIFEGTGLPQGCSAHAPKNVLYAVTDIYPDHVVIDGNHPLAGIALRIKLKVHTVREASQEEIERNSTGSSFFKIEPASTSAVSTHTIH